LEGSSFCRVEPSAGAHAAREGLASTRLPHSHSNQAHLNRHAEYLDHENTSRDHHLITNGRPSRDERLRKHQHRSGGSDSDRGAHYPSSLDLNRGAHYPSSLDLKQRTACYKEGFDQGCLSRVEQRFKKRQKAANRVWHGLASAPTSKEDQDAGHRSPHFDSALSLSVHQKVC
jgi:hypothetical protein